MRLNIGYIQGLLVASAIGVARMSAAGEPEPLPELLIPDVNVPADFDTFEIQIVADLRVDTDGPFAIGITWDPNVINVITVRALVHSPDSITIGNETPGGGGLSIYRDFSCDCPALAANSGIEIFGVRFAKLTEEPLATAITFTTVAAFESFPGGSSSFYREGEWLPVNTREGWIRMVDGQSYIRGDANMDGQIDIGDAVRILTKFFILENLPVCDELMDVDANGQLNITDPIALLGFIFLGLPSPREPFPSCGVDQNSWARGCLPPTVYANGCAAVEPP